MMRHFLSLIASLLVVALAGAAHAEVPTPKTRIDAIYGLIKSSSAKAETQDQLVAEVTGHLDGLVDYEGFASRTLKTSWPKLTPVQRETFMNKFKSLIIRTYAKRFQPKSEFTVEHRGEPGFLNEDKTEAKVQTTVHGKKVAADVDYMLVFRPEKKNWFAYDFVVDDVSMSLNWRGQFEKIIAKEGFDALIAKIDKKIQKDETQ
ncbi:MAG: ABC transporter substrate-binding protein [Deltaproteobacteria bacterium]|nr:ABC transporter substrate-binding protein [Deltaproteobacteria bacterium]